MMIILTACNSTDVMDILSINEAVLDGTPFVKCFCCPNCQYGPGMPHKCPAEMKRMA